MSPLSESFFHIENAHKPSDISSVSIFSGVDDFTIAAWDGKEDSNLGLVTIKVTGGSGIFSNGFETGDTSGWD